MKKLVFLLLIFIAFLPLTWYVYGFSSGVGETLFMIAFFIYLYYIIYYSDLEFEFKLFEYFKSREKAENGSYLAKLSSEELLLAGLIREIIADYLSYKYELSREEVKEILQEEESMRNYIRDETFLKFLLGEGDPYEALEKLGEVVE